jgi:hypothetical protein
MSKNKELDRQIERDDARAKAEGRAKESEAKYKRLLAKYNALSKQSDQLAEVSAHKPKTHEIKAVHKGVGEAVALLLASDWHMEEVVEADKVNGLNEYNPEIAKQRAHLFFVNGLKLTKLSAQGVKINGIVIGALGDMISSHLHPELMENNALSPMEALILFRDTFISGIKYLLKNSDYGITVLCKDGNHGRNTEKIRVSTRTENSAEWLIYHMIAAEFKDNDRVKFVIERGEFSYLKIFDTTVRFLHGDSVSYGGGVGGIHIPLRKAIAQWDKAVPADFTCCGHFHQMEKSKKYAVNGSLIGWNPYAARIKADFERPQQTFLLIDKEWGPTIHAPIRVTDKP